MSKFGSWLVDYGYMLRGAAATVVHRNPPKHYLGYRLANKIPVILVPGILGKWSFMKQLGDAISLQGHPVYIVPELGYNIGSIPSSAKILRSLLVRIFSRQSRHVPRVSGGAKAIRAVIEKEDIKGAVLVAHSKGGLIGKYLLAHHNKDGKVLGMVAVAAPFAGSAMAKLVPLEPFDELSTDSDIIHDLEKHHAANGKIVSIFPRYDNHVWAKRGSYLPGARNIEVPVSGHHKVIFDVAVQRVVLKAIEEIASGSLDVAKRRVPEHAA